MQFAAAGTRALFTERRVRSAFIGLTAELPAGIMPEPRHWWDNARRSDNAILPKGTDAIVAARAVMLAAISTGDEGVIARTLLRVERYFDELKAAAIGDLAELIDAKCPTLLQALMDASRETSEAMHAMVVAGTTKANGDMEEAAEEVSEAIVSLDAFRDRALAAVRTPDAPVMAVRA